ncbi:MAG: hypothetical protein ABSF55_02615 [Candidatus Staskawiczbacteria bacterium]|jgi:hypothetical protein
MKINKFLVVSLIIFLVVYSLYVFYFNLNIEDYSDIIVAVVFFFTLFSGFFITRQNDRYTSIAEEISNTDGDFSLLYRIAGVVPWAQDKIREVLRHHYTKILETNNWAYHILNPSTTITKVFDAYREVNDKNDDDAEKLSHFSDASGQALADVQVSRKKMIMLYQQKLLPLQWALVYILGALMVISFNFIPNHTLIVDLLKIFFGVAVLFVILLLKQLDDLSIFGKDFNKQTANDMLRIIDEKDLKETK